MHLATCTALQDMHADGQLIGCACTQEFNCQRRGQMYNMLNVFSLTQFSRIVFVDADILVMRNMDELFCIPTFAAG